ncbi:MAG: aminodeoxychorismate synthase component I [Glaciecola sp.]|jgi:para-aminobenzoate synthetase component 1|nr:aminodeoxychorismate synthase component I [Glaciecola sp.]MDG2100646.1 aminodeoxychorismate synthase component I [Glaciecola sp.]
MSLITIKTLDEFAHIPPERLFSAVAHLADSIFLDSTGNTGNDAQFDILLFAPVATYSVTNGRVDLSIVPEALDCVQINQNEQASLTSHQDPFIALRHLHEHIIDEADLIASKRASQHSALFEQLPFLIGSAGYAGYDAGRYLEVLPQDNPAEYDTPDFHYGIYLHSIVYDRNTNQYYWVADSRSTTIAQPGLVLMYDLLQTLEIDTGDTRDEAFVLTAQWQANMTQAQYITRLDRLHQYIVAGDCYQANIAQRFDAPYTGNEYDGYLRLREQNNAPFSAFIKTEQGAILCISPERFLAVHDRQVETKPIKGTMPRYADPILDLQSADTLLSSEKDQAENLMIVDLLRNDLSKHCSPHSVKVPKLFALESYPAVHHMVSTVTGTLNADSEIFALLSGAFPGGSITGAPKVRAMQIIEELEPNRRNIYCGAIGYIGVKHDMDTNICIRTLLCENGKIYCWAGGGIVLDSIAHNEYAETLAKVSKILPILQQDVTWTDTHS